MAQHCDEAPLCLAGTSAAAKLVRHLTVRADELVCVSDMLQDWDPQSHKS